MCYYLLNWWTVFGFLWHNMALMFASISTWKWRRKSFPLALLPTPFVGCCFLFIFAETGRVKCENNRIKKQERAKFLLASMNVYHFDSFVNILLNFFFFFFCYVLFLIFHFITSRQMYLVEGGWRFNDGNIVVVFSSSLSFDSFFFLSLCMCMCLFLL